MKYCSRVRSVCLLVCGAAGTFAAGQNPCREHSTQAAWKVFVDQKLGFCFEYPPQYQIAPPRHAPGVSGTDKEKWLGRLATKPGSVELATADDEENAIIDIYLSDAPCSVDRLKRSAPTGYADIPPKRIRTAHGTFYFYGAGGGGVDYPDEYYTRLQGGTLTIAFIGPYAGDKTATKHIEPKVLASFRRFGSSPPDKYQSPESPALQPN
jgi:hypothetical protein